MHRERGIAIQRLIGLTAGFCLLATLCLTLGMEPAFATDTDGDGITDAMETVFGTDPNDSDSDDDNLTDFAEIYMYGTDPNETDTDGDATDDDQDQDPLDDGTHAGGVGAPDSNYSENLAHEAVAGTTPFEGYRVNAMTGELALRVATIDFGPGYFGRNQLG